MYGLQLVDNSRGRLKRGTVYVTLGRMEDKGLVESEHEPAPERQGGLPRRMYRTSAHGARVLNAWTAATRALGFEHDAMANEYSVAPFHIAAFLVPSAMPIALSISLFVAVLLQILATNDRRILFLLRGILPFAFACCIGAQVLTNWIVPVSNQAFRVAIYNAMRPAGSPVVTLSKGNNERRWSELSALTAQRGSDAAERAQSAMRMRLALSVAPLIAALIAISFGVHLPRMFRVLRNP
jgi:PadR family transcriptional regulator